MNGDKKAPGRRPADQPSARLSRRERAAQGKAARLRTPLDAHADIGPDTARDPIGLLLDQAKTRVPELVPIRHGRMLVSPFSFFRGAALPMAADLAGTPSTGLRAQLCGDAHLSNFGAFASPERRLLFDINDFDETLPGPFEWDVKRLAASFAIAARANGYPAKTCRKITVEVGASYREAMRAFSRQPFMDVWYAHLDVTQALDNIRTAIGSKQHKAVEAGLATARTRDSRQALRKLTTTVDGQQKIISNPPTIVPIEEIFNEVTTDTLYGVLATMMRTYARSLPSDRQHLLAHFTLRQVARKAVGVGSVGTRAWIVLLEGSGKNEPLFLQAKEAQPSVLAAYCGRSRHGQEGERVVAGQRLMQAASDIFLGWTRSADQAGERRDFYVRQLRDWKFSVPIEAMRPQGLAIYARMCGWTLARAHARSGDRVALAAYLGRSDTFEQAIADFADSYADRNQRDYARFAEAAKLGEVEAVHGI
jgi:uncharacterized protein (DUF2252 family)